MLFGLLAGRVMRLVRRISLVWAALTLLACPESSARKPAAACAKAYDKCVLANGVLGICDQVECAEGRAGPCLVCRSQH
jgi:hypothetical protein